MQWSRDFSEIINLYIPAYFLWVVDPKLIQFSEFLPCYLALSYMCHPAVSWSVGHLLVLFLKIFLLRWWNWVHTCTTLECTHEFTEKLCGCHVSLEFPPYCVLLLCVFLFPVLRPESWGFSCQSLSLLLQLLPHSETSSRRTEGEQNQWGFDPPSWDQSSTDCKAGFPSQSFELLLLPQGDCWWLGHK